MEEIQVVQHSGLFVENRLKFIFLDNGAAQLSCTTIRRRPETSICCCVSAAKFIAFARPVPPGSRPASKKNDSCFSNVKTARCEARTHDLRIMRPTLYRLSQSSIFVNSRSKVCGSSWNALPVSVHSSSYGRLSCLPRLYSSLRRMREEIELSTLYRKHLTEYCPAVSQKHAHA
ncbi:hypothetical protein RvY_09218 [Ramazzottius varieornatus]|uniref:Uncharacterized protein n=1 Tax=Ramazzottius varieornatus TaxID=947166 RepID=A0A1D1V8P0_RAMVA|nr:hypothetical protein RvY_09218 [Ramazzottius varieornatus]